MPRGHRVVARERTHEPLSKFSANGVLELLTAAHRRLRHALDAGAVNEEAIDGSTGGRRCGFHGTPDIGAPITPAHPWRE